MVGHISSLISVISHTCSWKEDTSLIWPLALVPKKCTSSATCSYKIFPSACGQTSLNFMHGALPHIQFTQITIYISHNHKLHYYRLDYFSALATTNLHSAVKIKLAHKNVHVSIVPFDHSACPCKNYCLKYFLMFQAKLLYLVWNAYTNRILEINYRYLFLTGCQFILQYIDCWICHYEAYRMHISTVL